MNRVKTWSRRLARSRRAYPVLFTASFLETVIVPIPIELVLLPYMQMARERIWTIATVTLAGCLVGAVLGYGVGLLFMDSAGLWIIEQLGWQDDYAAFRAWFERRGFWAVIAVGVVPIPFQVAMLAAGAADYPFALFVIAAAIARGVRYYGLAVIVLLVGNRAEALWRAHSRTVGVALAVLVLAVFVGAEFLSAAD